MEKSDRFSGYSFAKMGQSEGGGPSQLPADSPPSKGVRKFLHDNLLLIVTISGVLLGIIIGFSLRSIDLNENVIMLISYPGELFMRILKLMILPLIVASLIAGSASINAKMNGKIAIRTLVYFVLTSTFNAFLGICLVVAIHPGDPGMKHVNDINADNARDVNILDSLLDLGRNIFPDNLFQAAFQQAHTVYIPVDDRLVDQNVTNSSFNDVSSHVRPVEMVRVIRYRSGTNTIGIVFFCLVFGTVLGTLGERGKVVLDFFTAVFEVIMKMVTGVMWLTPIGVSSVIAGKILAVKELDIVMSQLAWFIATIAIGVFFYQLIIVQIIYFVIVKKNPYKFYWGLIQATLTASATASTAAALPISFRCMTEKLKVDPRVTRFVLPIGCNINMDGTALFLATASIFIAQMNRITLGFGELCTVLLTSTAASMSSASVPSAALVLLLIVLSSIDAPTQNVSLLFAIDWFVDRIRTTNNMLGDCYAAAVVEQLSKKELMACDGANYYQETIGLNGRTDNGDISSKGSASPDTVIVDMSLHAQNYKSDIIKT
ncbi:excitatory amino acid transporter 2 isoform X2 [Arctopsyche grandis]|uniref:excitatory amino acid transporter 2 isoform X2 n=1 Tax=Arctopsyche grandis TaxID=121162 RepID=UPI00406D775B